MSGAQSDRSDPRRVLSSRGPDKVVFRPSAANQRDVLAIGREVELPLLVASALALCLLPAWRAACCTRARLADESSLLSSGAVQPLNAAATPAGSAAPRGERDGEAASADEAVWRDEQRAGERLVGSAGERLGCLRWMGAPRQPAPTRLVP